MRPTTLDTADISDVAVWCAQRLDLELVVMAEDEYYAGLLAFYRPVRAMSWPEAIELIMMPRVSGSSDSPATVGLWPLTICR